MMFCQTKKSDKVKLPKLKQTKINFVIEKFSGIKDFSNWPTIPQIFIDGEFVGGCDIMLQMHQNGELIEELKKVGITSTLLENSETKEKTKWAAITFLGVKYTLTIAFLYFIFNCSAGTAAQK